ncbi:MAG: hypothetical protein JWQ04_523 [Pedosphaera sp.]|nr:hypothetical protein [Pedosphaera sp.]
MEPAYQREGWKMKPTLGLTRLFCLMNLCEKKAVAHNVCRASVLSEKHAFLAARKNLFFLHGKRVVFLHLTSFFDLLILSKKVSGKVSVDARPPHEAEFCTGGNRGNGGGCARPRGNLSLSVSSVTSCRLFVLSGFRKRCRAALATALQNLAGQCSVQGFNARRFHSGNSHPGPPHEPGNIEYRTSNIEYRIGATPLPGPLPTRSSLGEGEDCLGVYPGAARGTLHPRLL